jgi:excinuclease UvrABC helicase subunit UvrB
MTWFRRGHETPPVQPEPERDADSPDLLRQRLWELVQFINRNAGKLPVEAVVMSRQITDTIREVIETSTDRDLDVYAVVSINGIVGDYLPTTLRTYLNLDPALTERPGPSGRTPRTALREQVDALASAAAELLHATQEHDVDSLFTQGNFLRTKFTRSDLDL